VWAKVKKHSKQNQQRDIQQGGTEKGKSGKKRTSKGLVSGLGFWNRLSSPRSKGKNEVQKRPTRRRKAGEVTPKKNQSGGRWGRGGPIGRAGNSDIQAKPQYPDSRGGKERNP